MADNGGKTLFTRRVSGGKNRNYFIDVRESGKNGNKYLVMSESRNVEGSWTNTRVMVFPEHLKDWRDTLDEALQLLEA